MCVLTHAAIFDTTHYDMHTHTNTALGSQAAVEPSNYVYMYKCLHSCMLSHTFIHLMIASSLDLQSNLRERARASLFRVVACRIWLKACVHGSARIPNHDVDNVATGVRWRRLVSVGLPQRERAAPPVWSDVTGVFANVGGDERYGTTTAAVAAAAANQASNILFTRIHADRATGVCFRLFCECVSCRRDRTTGIGRRRFTKE